MQLWFSTHTNIFFFVSNLDCRNKFLGWNLLSFIMSSCRWYFVVCKSCATSSHTTRAANFIALLNVKCNLFSLNNFAGLMFRPWKVKFHLQSISVIIGFDMTFLIYLEFTICDNIYHTDESYRQLPR